MITVDAAVGVDFLQHWFESTPEEQWVMLFSIEHGTGERRTAWKPVGRIEELTADIERIAARGDLWFGTATRKQRLPGNLRGGVSECSYLPGLYVDVDIEGEGHKLPNLPPTKEAAVELIKRFPLKPSTVVHSGYGLQCYWRFVEPVASEDAMVWLARCKLTWERLAGEAGYHIDNVWSLDHIMRLPGTHNWKGAA